MKGSNIKKAPPALVAAICCLLPATALTAAVPTGNPMAARYGSQPDAVPAWLAALPWDRTISIANVQGTNDDDRVRTAQTELVKQGGGVIFFPAGTYTFRNDIVLEDGVILRGETPAESNAKAEAYALTTRFEFPKYLPSMEGAGTPIDTAFKGIRLSNPAKASNCGLANIAINRGHVDFEEGQDHACGTNRFVFGCLLSNTAVADPSIPNKDYQQQPHQRFTARHHAAIYAFSHENLFVANNRLPKSGDDNFTVKPYTLVSVLTDIAWAHDNVNFNVAIQQHRRKKQ